MSISKWFLKNGPGSPGSTAKAFAKQYNKTPKYDHDSEWREIFLYLCHMRIANSAITISSGNLYSKVNIDEVINFSGGCMALFVFEMMYIETMQFRENIFANNENFTLSTEIIHEIIIDNCPTAIRYNLNEFRQLAIKFTNFINR